MIVGGVFVRDQFATAVRVQVFFHVVGLGLHVHAQLVKAAGADHVAFAIDLPGNGGEGGTYFIVARRASRRSSELGHVHTPDSVNDHALEQVGVIVLFIVHNGKYLRLDTNLACRGFQANHSVCAKDTVIKRCLVLPRSSASPGGTVGPVDLVGLANLHVLAMLPLVLGGKLGIGHIVEAALEAFTGLVGQVVVRARAKLIILAHRIVFRAQVPVNLE